MALPLALAIGALSGAPYQISGPTGAMSAVLIVLAGRLRKEGGTLMFSGVHPGVRKMIERGGVADRVGDANFFWSADEAIVEAERRECGRCAERA